MYKSKTMREIRAQQGATRTGGKTRPTAQTGVTSSRWVKADKPRGYQQRKRLK